MRPVPSFQTPNPIGKRVSSSMDRRGLDPPSPRLKRARVTPTLRIEASGKEKKDWKMNTDRKLITSFEPMEFIPFLSSNPNFQTMFSNYFPRPAYPSYTRLRLATDDGLTTFLVDVANGESLSPSGKIETGVIPCAPVHENEGDERKGETEKKKSPPVVVILTGLESCSEAVVTRRIVNALSRKKYKTFVINYRSCGGKDDKQKTLRLYHAGFTEDLEALLRAIKHAAVEDGYVAPDVLICGFSLGANVVCNFLGRHGDLAKTRYNVIAGAGACVPFDPQACQLELDQGWKGHVYSRHVIRNMSLKFEAVLKNIEEDDTDIRKKMSTIYDIEAIRNAKRLGLIDDLYISPTFGFANRAEYYRVVDSRSKLKNIRVPLFILNARDDPFFDHLSGKSLPTDKHIEDAPVLIHLTEHGGHCGFLDEGTMGNDTDTGFFQREFVRWFDHVNEFRKRNGDVQE